VNAVSEGAGQAPSCYFGPRTLGELLHRGDPTKMGASPHDQVPCTRGRDVSASPRSSTKKLFDGRARGRSTSPQFGGYCTNGNRSTAFRGGGRCRCVVDARRQALHFSAAGGSYDGFMLGRAAQPSVGEQVLERGKVNGSNAFHPSAAGRLGLHALPHYVSGKEAGPKAGWRKAEERA